MMIKDIIKHKINQKSRENIVYIHPVISDEEIAKYISAFSNDNGGIILFGVKDDGIDLWIKNSVFNINKREKNIREIIDINAKFEFGEILDEKYRLEYIYVKKNDNTIYFNESIYNIDKKTNKPNKIQNKTIFLSYCWNDSDIADIVEEKLTQVIKTIKVSRDIHDVGYKKSLSKFMESIGSKDYVISILSDSYLKSRNCMYEILELSRDRRYMDKLLYIVIFNEDVKLYKGSNVVNAVADIYTIQGKTKYILWWKDKEKEVEEEIKQLGDHILIKNHVEELQIIKKIQLEIQDFMKEISDSKAVPLVEMLESDFKDIISQIKFD